jgi:signal transduction histidine kinase/DNA-binding response OmpR family regulator/outer membrane protein assembly factor BamB
LGTLRGLFRVRPNPLNVSRIKIRTPTYIPLNNQIEGMTADADGNIVMNTRNDGLFSFDPKAAPASPQAMQRLPYLTERVTYLGTAADGQLMLAQNNLIFRRKTARDKPVLVAQINGEVNTMLEVVPGEWWIGVRKGGLFSYVENNKPLFFSLLKRVNAQFNGLSPIFATGQDEQGNIWIGSRGDGLVRANRQTGTVTKYAGNTQRGLTSLRILSIHTDSRKRVWVATREGGLFLYQPDTDTFRAFTTDDGLPSNVVCALAEDRAGNLFVSTDNGLAVYLPDEVVPFRAFGVGDGIEHTYFSFNARAVDQQGRVYFGNSNGLYVVNGLHIEKKPPTKLYISHFRVLDDPRQTTGRDTSGSLWEQATHDRKLTLTHRQNSFELAWSALDFNDPTRNRYAYRLNPYSEKWTVVSGEGRRVQFLDIPAGEYTLQVRHSDSNGFWNEGLTTVAITVQPPFWLTKWAWIVYALLLLLAGWGAFTLWKRYRRLELSLADEMANKSLQTQQMVHFSDLSHEIRNRLTLMLGPLEKALNGKKVNQGVLHNLYEQTIRLKRISDQIMSIRRSEGGEFTLKVGETKLGAFIGRVVQDVEPLALIRAISLEKNTSLTDETGWLDDELLEIVLLNILNNALKYTPEGGRVSIGAERVLLDKSELPAVSPLEGSYLKCTIEDTGIGIPETDLNYLFSRYYRASNTRQRVGELSGTGLGLELVGRLLKKHKGFIDVQSHENAFTRVTFFIPIDKEHYEVGERKISVSSDRIVEIVALPDAVSGEPATPLNPNRYRVLVADDDADIRQLLVDTFGAEAAVTTATNGEEALQLAVSHDFDAIISDLAMPRMGGLALLQTLKTNPLLNHIPFVVLTGTGADNQKLRCLQSNADDFIEKPFSPDLLRWRVKNLIQSRQLLREKYSHIVSLGPTEEPIESEDEKFLNRVVELIEQHIASDELTVEFLAEQCHMSRATFYRHIEGLIGEPPSVFIRKYRLKKAALLLKNADKYIAQVAYETGFNDPKYFAKCFVKEFGYSPAEYVKRLKAEPETNATP